METNKQKIIEILHGMKTSYKDCEIMADSIIALFKNKSDKPSVSLCAKKIKTLKGKPTKEERKAVAMLKAWHENVKRIKDFNGIIGT